MDMMKQLSLLILANQDIILSLFHNALLCMYVYIQEQWWFTSCWRKQERDMNWKNCGLLVRNMMISVEACINSTLMRTD